LTYFDFSGRHDETEKFVYELGLNGDIERLSRDDLKWLGSARSLLPESRPDPSTPCSAASF
jgi:hypothetical protein